MCFDWVGSLDALQSDFLDLGNRLPVNRAVLGLKTDRVGVDDGDDIRRDRFLAVRENRGGLDGPGLAVARPGALAEPAVVEERPRPDGLRGRIPPDPLRAAADGDVLDRGGECR